MQTPSTWLRRGQAQAIALCWALVLVLFVPAAQAEGQAQGQAQGSVAKWDTYEVQFQGPSTDETQDNPNPFLDYRLQVTFTSPSGREVDVPGFYDGDGQGLGVGNVWTVRFAPDEVGPWTWSASFRQGTDIAVDLSLSAGTPVFFDGQTGSVDVTAIPPGAPGFLGLGRLSYVGEHYLRHGEGKWFLKSGTDSPENLFGYSGFDDVIDQGGLGIIHDYAPHVGDWLPGQPEFGAAGSPNGLKGLIGALNYLNSAGVNAVYMLPMNLGGDGQETTPFIGYQKTPYDKTHYDISRLEQWATVLDHAQRMGIVVQFVLAETEPQNESWLDEGAFGLERKLFFRELIARFAHIGGLKWNLSEENDFNAVVLVAMADYIHQLDPYDHPLAVHTNADDFSDYFALLGNPDFTNTSIQYSNPNAGQYVEDWRSNSAGAGQKWVLDMDENGTPAFGVTDMNAEEMRKEILWDVYLSGGQLEWYLGGSPLPLGGDQSVEDFRTREEMWDYTRIARTFLEENLPFWLMEPDDALLSGEDSSWGGGEVFKLDDELYAIYLPDANPSGTLDLTATTGAFRARWFDPRTGSMQGPAQFLVGGAPVALGPAPELFDEDWVVLVEAIPFFSDKEVVSLSAGGTQNLFLNAPPSLAGWNYQVVAGISGTEPGTPFFNFMIPLNWDAWSQMVFTFPTTTPGLSGFVGTLNATGNAQASLSLAPYSSLVGLVGITVSHAFLAGPSPVDVGYVSNPVDVVIGP